MALKSTRTSTRKLDMTASISVICYKYKTLSNGENPLMVRISQNGKRKLVSLGISVNHKFWNFEKQKPKPNCPNKEQIEILITNKLNEFNNQIIEFKSENKDFTAKTLIEKVSKPVKRMNVNDLFLQEIAQLKKEERIRYAECHDYVYKSLLKFNKHLDIYFSDIDVQWLKRYEAWLRSQGNSENTIGFKFRTLRTMYNIAIKEGYVKAEFYPFKKYKVSKLHEDTPKRAIVKDNVKKIVSTSANNAYKELAIDLFTFSYFTGGINFTDMARIKHDNIIDGRLAYKRKKTKKLIQLPLQPKAMEIINKYKSPSNPYIFPILSTFHKTEQQKINRIHKVIGKVNKHLKALGVELDLDKKLTTYVARHSFSTTLKRSGVSTSLICEALGHSSEKVTQIYLDSFENDQIDEAMSNLL